MSTVLNRGGLWMRGLLILGVMAFGLEAWATLPFEYDQNKGLLYIDGGYTYPAKVNDSGDVVFETTNGEWLSTGYTEQDLIDGGLLSGGAGESMKSPGTRLKQETARRHATEQARTATAGFMEIKLGPGPQKETYKGPNPLESFTEDAKDGENDVPAADLPEWQVFWGVSASYQSDDFDVLSGGAAAGKTRTRSQTLRMTALHENWRVESSLTYDRVDPDSALGDLAFDRLSLQVTPIYSLLEQAADGFDLALITSAAVSRSWFESGTGVDDPMHVFGAAGLGVGRTFSFGDLRLAGMYAAQKNTSGDEEVTGKGTIPMRIISGAYTVGFARNWVASVGVDYIHTGDLPSAYDSNEYYGTASLGYYTEKWEASLGITRSIHNDNQRSWSAAGSLTFRW